MKCEYCGGNHDVKDCEELKKDKKNNPMGLSKEEIDRREPLIQQLAEARKEIEGLKTEVGAKDKEIKHLNGTLDFCGIIYNKDIAKKDKELAEMRERFKKMDFLPSRIDTAHTIKKHIDDGHNTFDIADCILTEIETEAMRLYGQKEV